MDKKRYSLKTNIGFLLNKPIGHAHDFSIEYPEVFIDPDLNVTNLKCDYRISRTQEGLLFQGKLKGTLEAQCVRCLESTSVDIETSIDELYFFPGHVKDDTELTIPDDGYIDLAEVFRDYLLLGLPIHLICRPDCKCLCVSCGANLNLGDCEHTDNRVDFRDR